MAIQDRILHLAMKLTRLLCGCGEGRIHGLHLNEKPLLLNFRMLQDHHSVQPCADGGAMCRVLNCPMPAHGRQSQAHGR